MAKVTGKFQITLPKALAERCGIRIGDELDLRAIGRSIRIDRQTAGEGSHLRHDRLTHFDQATTRQRTRERTASFARTRSRGWTREELHESVKNARRPFRRRPAQARSNGAR